MEIHGVIGADVFENFIVEISYSRKRLTLHKPETFVYRKWLQRRCSYPIELHNSKPYLTLPAITHNNDTLTLKMLIDTGSSDALWIFTNSKHKILLPKTKRYSLLGRGLNGNINGWQSRVSELVICKKNFLDVSASYPDTSAIAQSNQLNSIGRNGSIGAGIIKRFDVIFDYRNKKITLRPNQFYKEPFHYNMSGITLEQPYKTLPIFIITQVRKNSPADKAGVQEGDQLITINGESSITSSLPQINSEFRTKPGRKIKMKLLRKGELIKIQFRLVKDI